MSTVHFVASVANGLDNADNALGPPDGVWAGLADDSWTQRWALDSPEGVPSGTQTITFRVRKSATGGGDPDIDSVTLIQGGVSTEIAADFTVLSAEGEDYVVTFDSSILDGTLDGIDIELATSRGGGGPNARGVNIDAATWDVGAVLQVDFTGSIQAVETGQDSADLQASPAVEAVIGIVEAGQDTAALSVTSSVEASVGVQELMHDQASVSADGVVSGSIQGQEVGQDSSQLVADLRYDFLYELEWRPVGGTGTLVTGITTRYYELTDLDPSTTYEWRVRAVDRTVTGVWTQWQTFDTLEGQVAVEGLLAATEVGGDDAALTGTAPLDLVLAAVEQGQDATQIAAASTVDAFLSADEIGGDAAQIAGSLAVAGSVQAVEVGSDQVGIQAGVTARTQVQGTLAAQETGQDTVSLAVTAYYENPQAELAAVEQGDDAVALSAEITVGAVLGAQEDTFDSAEAFAQSTVAAVLAAQEDTFDSDAVPEWPAIGDTPPVDLASDKALTLSLRAQADGRNLRAKAEAPADLRAKRASVTDLKQNWYKR